MGSWDLAITLDRTAPAPLYLQLVKAIEEGIRHGRFRPGDALPGTRALADLIGVNRNTTLLEYRRGLPGGHIRSVHGCLSLKIPVSRDPMRILPIQATFEDASGRANATFSLIMGPVLLGRVVAAQCLRHDFDDVRQTFALDGTLIRLLVRWYLGSDDGPSSLLNKLVLGFRYDRRFYQDAQGHLRQTDEAQLTLGLVGGG